MTSTSTATRPSVHTGHAHPATKAARATCRRAMRGTQGATFTPTRWTRFINPALSHSVYLTLTSKMTATKHSFTVTRQGVQGKTAYATKATKGSDWFTSDLLASA